MNFIRQANKVANDALGPETLNSMRLNLAYLRALVGREHLSTGEHNALEIPRVCRQLDGASPPAVSPSSADITATSRTGTGAYNLTLATDRFTEDIRLQINPHPESAKPFIATYKVNSATSVDIYIKKLSTALSSAGNAWTAVNTKFDVAIHSNPLAATTWGGTASPWLRASATGGYGLVGGGSNTNPSHWSEMVREMATLQAALIAEHAVGGAHDTRQVAVYAEQGLFDSSVPKYMDAGAFTYSRTGTGVVEVTYSALTTPVSAFVCADYSRYSGGTDAQIIVNVDPNYVAGTKAKVTIYAWDDVNGWWESADADFFLVIHGS